jgi:hypothetical protein
MTPTRTIKGGPFCWQGKAELRRIADLCEDRKDRAQILAVYLALTWLSSDRQAEVFQIAIGRIAERSGVSYRKAADVLNLLSRVGLLSVSENFVDGSKERAPSTYTLGTISGSTSPPVRA